VVLLLLPKPTAARNKNTGSPKRLIRRRLEEEFPGSGDRKFLLSLCISVYMCVTGLRQSAGGDVHSEQAMSGLWLFTWICRFYLVTAY